MTVEKIESFVNNLSNLAEKYEMSTSLQEAVSRCKLAIAMYRMSDKYVDNVYSWFNQVWQQSYVYYKQHEKSYRKSELFNYLNSIFQGV